MAYGLTADQKSKRAENCQIRVSTFVEVMRPNVVLLMSMSLRKKLTPFVRLNASALNSSP